MLLILISLLFFGLASGAQVPQCSKLHVDITVNGESGLQVYSSSFDVDVVQSSKQYYNLITFFNFVNQSVNESIYYQSAPLQLWDGNEGIMLKCNYSDSCTFEIPDGVVMLEVPVSLNGYNDFISLLDDLYFDSGILFVSDYGFFFTPSIENCTSYEQICKHSNI